MRLHYWFWGMLCLAGWKQAERSREASLRGRVLRFYQDQGDSITQKKLERLLTKYETEAEFDAALNAKYSKALPPERAGALFGEDVVGASLYAASNTWKRWTESSTMPSSGTLLWKTAEARVRTCSTWWEARAVYPRLALVAVAWSALATHCKHACSHMHPAYASLLSCLFRL